LQHLELRFKTPSDIRTVSDCRAGSFRAHSHSDPAGAAEEQRRETELAESLSVAPFSGATVRESPRTLRRMVDEPDIVPGSRGAVWLRRPTAAASLTGTTPFASILATRNRSMAKYPGKITASRKDPMQSRGTRTGRPATMETPHAKAEESGRAYGDFTGKHIGISELEF
jgi:hypothetical protein